MFSKKNTAQDSIIGRTADFAYIGNDEIYMDSSCQTMRPKIVMDAIQGYYQNNNACGGRVKYRWGQIVDEKIEETRSLVLEYLGLKSKDYVCSFTLNTSYGLNLLLNQLPEGKYDKVITSEIEHNSVFLTTIELAKRLKIERLVLERQNSGELIYDKVQLKNAIVVVNAACNFDGRLLKNINQLIKDVHEAGGNIIIDAAQAMAHCHEILMGCEADAICFSAHKLYASSLGGIVTRKDFLKTLQIRLIGGGMVTAVRQNDYDLVSEDMASWLEPGLQAYGEIISLNASLKWLMSTKINGQKPSDFAKTIAKRLYDGLKQIPEIKVINADSAPVISIYSDNIDAHRLAVFLSAEGIMTRSGYFCCHYYLIEKKNYPPLLRLSVGLHNTEADIDHTLEAIRKNVRG